MPTIAPSACETLPEMTRSLGLSRSSARRPPLTVRHERTLTRSGFESRLPQNQANRDGSQHHESGADGVAGPAGASRQIGDLTNDADRGEDAERPCDEPWVSVSSESEYARRQESGSEQQHDGQSDHAVPASA